MRVQHDSITALLNIKADRVSYTQRQVKGKRVKFVVLKIHALQSFKIAVSRV